MKRLLIVVGLLLAGCVAPSSLEDDRQDSVIADVYTLPSDTEMDSIGAQRRARLDAATKSENDTSVCGHGVAFSDLDSWRAVGHPLVEKLGAKPTNLKLPQVPEIKLPAPAPAPKELARDSVLVDRFTEPGQSVPYTFDANAGELSLFELGTWGYARGWHSTTRMRVLDANGDALAEMQRKGAVLYRPFLAFTAPSPGKYTLELTAADQFFRYIVVRQSSYSNRDAGAVTPLGDARVVHSYLRDPMDSALYSFELAPNEEVSIKVLGERDDARVESRSMVRERGRGGAMAAMMGGDRSTGRMTEPSMDERAPPRVPMFPVLALDVKVDGEVVSEGATFARVRSAHLARCEVRVHSLGGDDGGLFELRRAPSPDKLALRGVVLGRDDEPLANVELAFLLDPDGDEWARTKSGADGSYSVSVPPGDYLVLLTRGDAKHDMRIGVARSSELDLLWPMRAK